MNLVLVKPKLSSNIAPFEFHEVINSFLCTICARIWAEYWYKARSITKTTKQCYVIVFVEAASMVHSCWDDNHLSCTKCYTYSLILFRTNVKITGAVNNQSNLLVIVVVFLKSSLQKIRVFVGLWNSTLIGVLVIALLEKLLDEAKVI